MDIYRSNGKSGEPFVAGVADQEECPACSKLSVYVEDKIRWHKERCGLANPDKLKRIHIIGGPGSGKTTLAHKIGSRLGIEVHELDLIAFTGPDYMQRELSERLTDVSSIASSPTWITEGIFTRWTDQLLECADIIVWLDQVSWGRSMWRTVIRFTRSALQEAKHRRGIGKFARFNDYTRHLQQLVQVFFFSRAYYSRSPSAGRNQIESRHSTVQHLVTYQGKVIHCNSEKGIQAFLDYLSYCCDC